MVTGPWHRGQTTVLGLYLSALRTHLSSVEQVQGDFSGRALDRLAGALQQAAGRPDASAYSLEIRIRRATSSAAMHLSRRTAISQKSRPRFIPNEVRPSQRHHGF